MRAIAVTLTLPLLIAPALLAAGKANERLADAATDFTEIMNAPDKGIPQDLIAKSECVIIIPGLKKAGFIVGAEYGRGFAECRKPNGIGWGAPAAVRLEGGSVGLQLGATETDLFMLVMNKSGMTKLTQDKFTLGADASAAAGPVGRTTSAQTDAAMSAEILSWSRSKGLFAGVSLKGAALTSSHDWNEELYGRKLSNREILMSGNIEAPPEAHALIRELDRYSSASSADRVEK
jgi:lipid-binding SYLF domain-containing protein